MFQVETTVTWRDWDAWRKAFALHGKVLGTGVRAAAGLQRLWGLGTAVLGAALCLAGALGGLFNLLTLLGVLCLLYGVPALRQKDPRAFLASRRAEAALRAEYPDRRLRLSFDGEGFSLWEPGGGGSYRYAALTDVWEDGERFYLFLQGEMRFPLRKADFTGGSPGEFREFISQAAGRPVEQIR